MSEKRTMADEMGIVMLYARPGITDDQRARRDAAISRLNACPDDAVEQIERLLIFVREVAECRLCNWDGTTYRDLARFVAKAKQLTTDFHADPGKDGR